MLETIRNDVESGRPFSEAISRYPSQFNALYVNMVRASEMSGSFARMLDRIASFMAQQLETRRMIISASVYPLIIAIMAISVTMLAAIHTPSPKSPHKGAPAGVATKAKYIHAMQAALTSE